MPSTTLASLVLLLCASRAYADPIDLILDQAKIVRVPAEVRMIVIGNPAIADATLIAGGLAVLTGKAYGRTNVLAYDGRGKELLAEQVEVEGPDSYIGVVHRGFNRTTYSCAPNCELRDKLGDGPQSANAPSSSVKPGAAKGGPCDNAEDRASDGSRCGGRAASERPGGRDEQPSRAVTSRDARQFPR